MCFVAIIDYPGEYSGTQPSAVEKPFAKYLKSGPLYQKGAVALAEKVKARKPLESKSRVRSNEILKSVILVTPRVSRAFSIELIRCQQLWGQGGW